MSSAVDNEKILQFLPFSSVISSSFWHKLTQMKIDVYALNDEPVEITGYYTNQSTSSRLPACLNVDYSSFENRQVSDAVSTNGILCQGLLQNTNTLEAFKEINKQTAINKCGEQIWNDILSGAALSNPSLLTRFLLLTFADLKKYQFYYWFAFPTLVFPSKILLNDEPKEVDKVLTKEELLQFQQAYDEFKSSHGQSAFVVEKNTELGYKCHPLKELANLKDITWIGFCDPSSLPTNPGWPLRNLLALLAHHHKERLVGLSILCWRDGVRDGQRRVGSSLLIEIKDVVYPGETDSIPKCLGWEKNERGKLGARTVNLSNSMDPERLAESAVDLNLKLMKWRLLPELNLDLIQNTKCLLLGAGTLGCYVARTLMAWGVRHITFIDNGRVSYSNPVRQSLFGFDNCLNGGQLKAESAANSLRKIFPGMISRGIDLRIPMPGHYVTDAEEVEKDVQMLADAIDEHDVVFLLTDTRESRWLPSMLSAYRGKLAINAALGFDTYLVMRHGQREPWNPGQVQSEKSKGVMRGALAGRQLGCYFCNDVVAPGNSTKDRTLDQQCTVTRPGISLIASGLAVELMVSVLQHPQGGNASAEISTDAMTTVQQHQQEELEKKEAINSSPLGVVPHSIRGFLHRHQQVLPATEAFFNCTACSPLVIQRYAEKGYTFLAEVFNDSDVLEQVSGLADLHKDIATIEDWDYPEESEGSTD
ncbi:ubiquitin-like modifier-activating enzyme ATG7 [Daphnia pulex]|uniref:ubiquitin-like modifier-activating enzyme ATG7 n=1 Tax=Daphnia pulex TaxID=6669 RepID=UPI001EDFC08D|nr:ubiquitin-like modifier-activating enzyme ATG7 [Daphnia pulex]